jgi:hypothetical protein
MRSKTVRDINLSIEKEVQQDQGRDLEAVVFAPDVLH